MYHFLWAICSKRLVWFLRSYQLFSICLPVRLNSPSVGLLQLKIIGHVQAVAEYTGLFTFVVQVLYFYNKTRKYDNVHVAWRTLVKVMLNVSSTGCNNKRQSFAKLSRSTIDNVLTNLLPAGLQDFFQVLSISNTMAMVNKLLECSPGRIVHWV